MAEAADILGAAAPARRRWLRRAVVLLAGTPVLAALVYAPAPPAQAADSAVDVQLLEVSPNAPVKSDTLTISGSVVNNSREAIKAAHVGLRLGPVVGDRASIDEVADRTGFRAGVDPGEIDPAYAVKIDSLPSKASQPFTINVPVGKLDLGKDGVYQLGVSLSGETDSRPYEQVLGIRRTFLPWQPEAAAKRSYLTYAWPLISTTRVTAETGSDESQTPSSSTTPSPRSWHREAAWSGWSPSARTCRSPGSSIRTCSTRSTPWPRATDPQPRPQWESPCRARARPSPSSG
ncbi:hypothetical protein ACFSNO_04660 [Streptomyces cirratus]